MSDYNNEGTPMTPPTGSSPNNPPEGSNPAGQSPSNYSSPSGQGSEYQTRSYPPQGYPSQGQAPGGYPPRPPQGQPPYGQGSSAAGSMTGQSPYGSPHGQNQSVGYGQQPYGANPQNQGQYNPKPEKKGGGALKIVGIVILVIFLLIIGLLVAGFFGFQFVKNKVEDAVSNNPGISQTLDELDRIAKSTELPDTIRDMEEGFEGLGEDMAEMGEDGYVEDGEVVIDPVYGGDYDLDLYNPNNLSLVGVPYSADHLVDQGPIQVGETKEGISTTEAGATYSINLTKGQKVGVSLVADNVDVELYIADPDGFWIINENDFDYDIYGGIVQPEGNYNPYVEFIAPKDGTYKVLVDTYATGERQFKLAIKG